MLFTDTSPRGTEFSMDLTSVFGMIFDVDIVDQIKSDSLFSTGVSDRCEKHLAITKSECQENVV